MKLLIFVANKPNHGLVEDREELLRYGGGNVGYRRVPDPPARMMPFMIFCDPSRSFTGRGAGEPSL